MTARCSLLVAAAIAAAVAPAQILGRTEPFHPTRLAIAAFGTQAEIEVRDLPEAEAEEAIQAALLEIHEIDRLTDPFGDHPLGVAQLNAAAGQGPRAIDPRLYDLMRRMLLICLWSQGAHGPLGGELAELWRRPGEGRATPGELRVAVVRSECSRLTLTQDDGARAELAPDSRVDVSTVARGYAVDRAVEGLREAGAGNLLVAIGGDATGDVRRALGDGVDGKGWLTRLPVLPASGRPLDEVWLRDQAMAIASDLAGNVGLVDQRTGVPPRGVATVVTITELAVEAQSLAEALYILGLHEGQRRLGTLDPSPSVYWLLGEGDSPSVESAYNWSAVEPVRRRR